MKNPFIKSMSFVLAGIVAATAWAAEGPIGALTVQGKATITAEDTRFTLQDQEYAYFSGDRIETEKGAQARVAMSDGLKIGVTGSSAATVTRDEESYVIELEEGHVVVHAGEGVEYRITHNGEVVSPDQAFNPSDDPYVASVMNGEVQFYMPAQTDGGGSRFCEDTAPECGAALIFLLGLSDGGSSS